MAKVVAPLLSLEASGQLGGALVFGNRNGRNIVKSFSRPKRLPSNAQNIRRELYRGYVLDWHELSQAEKDVFSAEALARGRISGFHQFLHERLLLGTPALPWSATKRTTSAHQKYSPQFQVVGSVIYYVWREMDAAAKYQIWTAVMNTDGSGWVATKRTTSAYSKYEPQLQVVGTVIYYIWRVTDATGKAQIYTAEVNTDGSGWNVIFSTTTAYSKVYSQFQVVGTVIYYIWREIDAAGKYQAWTAVMDTDGSGFIATKRTTSVYDKRYMQLQVVGTKIYYAWQEPSTATKKQIWTAVMNTDGSGWVATERTTSAYNKEKPQLQVVGTVIYYVWFERDVPNKNQIVTAVMNTDGSGFTPTMRTSTPRNCYDPQLFVLDTKIYYIWNEIDVAYKYQIWTGVLNINGTGWRASQRTVLAFNRWESQLQIVGTTIYYLWRESDAVNKYQIWTAEMGVLY